MGDALARGECGVLAKARHFSSFPLLPSARGLPIYFVNYVRLFYLLAFIIFITLRVSPGAATGGCLWLVVGGRMVEQ